MLETKPLHPLLFFITRLLMLIGMMIVFGSVGYMVGVYGGKWFFGADFIQSPNLLSALDENPQVLPAAKWMQVMFSAGLLLLPALVFPNALQQPTLRHHKLVGPFKPKWLVMAFVLWLVSVPMVGALVIWNQQVKLPLQWHELEQQLRATEDAATAITKAFLQGDSINTLLVNLLVMALLPAIAEELFFRGALQQLFQKSTSNIHVSIALTALLFTCFHMQFYGLVPRFVLGVFLGYLFACSNSIWPAIVFHFVNNALAVVVYHFHLNEQVYWMSETYEFPLLLTVFSSAGSIVLLGWIYRSRITTADAT